MEQKQGQRTDHSPSDEQIVELYWNRQEIAISLTERKYGAYLYTVAYNIIHNDLDCEECLNDTYLGAWNAIPPKRPTVLQVFLAKITRNLALGRFRQMTAGKRVPSELVVSLEELEDCLSMGNTVEEAYEISRISAILSDYLRELTDRQSFIFVCRYYYADPVNKIADMLHMSRNTVFRELTAIRAGLKERLEKEGIHV